MRDLHEMVVETLCLLLAGALVSLPVTARASTPAAAGAALEQLGTSPAEADARVAALDDTELASLATDLEEQPAGADPSGEDVAIAFVITAGVVFIVLIITDATGVTDIFPWVRKPGQRRHH